MGLLAEVELELAEHAEHPAWVELGARVGFDHFAQLGQRLAGGHVHAGVVELGAVEHGGLTLVRPAEQVGQLALQLGQEASGLRAGGAQAVEVVERPAPGLPDRARLLGGVRAFAADFRLEAVRQSGLVEQSRRSQPGEKVVGRGLSGERSAAHEREQASAQAGVAQRHASVQREGDLIGAEDLLEQRGVVAGPAQDNGDVTGLDTGPQQLQQSRSGQFDLGPLAAAHVEADGLAGLHPLPVRLVLEEPALHVVQRGARLRRVVIVDRGQPLLDGTESEQLLCAPARALKAARPGS